MSVDAAGSKDELDLAYVGREANPATHGASIMEPGGWPNGSLAGSQPGPRSRQVAITERPYNFKLTALITV